VWQEVSEVYEGGLLNFPEDVKRRSEYAKLAAQCGRWDVAREQFRRLGDGPDLSVFISKASYEYLRRKAERLGGGGATTRAATAP
jgi:hypothetical protein